MNNLIDSFKLYSHGTNIDIVKRMERGGREGRGRERGKGGEREGRGEREREGGRERERGRKRERELYTFQNTISDLAVVGRPLRAALTSTHREPRQSTEEFYHATSCHVTVT